MKLIKAFLLDHPDATTLPPEELYALALAWAAELPFPENFADLARTYFASKKD